MTACPISASTRAVERFTRPVLTAWSQAVLESVGLGTEHASTIAAYLAEADERGHPSHGTDQLPSYFRGFRDGHLEPRPQIEVVQQKGSLAVVEGDNGLGHVVADYSMGLAIDLARDTGMGLVTARNSNHFGMAGHWPLKAIRAGMIGFTTTNGPPVMAPWGGKVGSICNNPFSWGLPAGEEPPILLDMALTSGARGKVRLANQRGDEIPAGWALDPDGRPTTNAQAALDGVMLPLSQHKGSGMAIVNEVLASSLSGSLFLGQVSSVTMASTGVHVAWKIGHLFMALDPGAMRPVAEYEAQVDAIIRELHAVPAADGHERVSVPGEGGLRRAAEAERLGVPLSTQSVSKLTDFGIEAGVDFPLHRCEEEIACQDAE